MNMVKRTYSPSTHDCISVVEVTEEQAIALDKLEEIDEFSAYFWSSKVEWLNNGDLTDDNQKVVRYNNYHYVIGPEKEGSFPWRGCGGAKHIVEFTTGHRKGSKVISTNIWHQGDIPEELRDILKDNGTIKQETIEFDFLNNEIRKGDAL